MKPTEEDIRILFEGKSEDYMKLYEQELDDFVDYDDFEELKQLDEPEKLVSLFELLFTIPVGKEDDDDEVVLALGEEFLPYEVDADYADNGLMITAKGQEHFMILKNAPEDRYQTLRKLNEIISPEHEMRVMQICLNDDIHSFIILESNTWKDLEKKYGAKVKEHFASINDAEFL